MIRKLFHCYQRFIFSIYLGNPEKKCLLQIKLVSFAHFKYAYCLMNFSPKWLFIKPHYYFFGLINDYSRCLIAFLANKKWFNYGETTKLRHTWKLYRLLAFNCRIKSSMTIEITTPIIYPLRRLRYHSPRQTFHIYIYLLKPQLSSFIFNTTTAVKIYLCCYMECSQSEKSALTMRGSVCVTAHRRFLVVKQTIATEMSADCWVSGAAWTNNLQYA